MRSYFGGCAAFAQPRQAAYAEVWQLIPISTAFDGSSEGWQGVQAYEGIEYGLEYRIRFIFRFAVGHMNMILPEV